jgi:hypothetical protein
MPQAVSAIFFKIKPQSGFCCQAFDVSASGFKKVIFFMELIN